MRLSDPIGWNDLAWHVFGCSGELLRAETVLDKIQLTNTCANLDSPVRVYIDTDGDFFVEVYDQ